MDPYVCIAHYDETEPKSIVGQPDVLSAALWYQNINNPQQNAQVPSLREVFGNTGIGYFRVSEAKLQALYDANMLP